MTEEFRPGPSFRRRVDQRSAQLRQRRRLLVTVAAGAAGALAVALPLALTTGHSRTTVEVSPTTTSPSPTSVNVKSVPLPADMSYNQLSIGPEGDLILGGSLASPARTATPSCVVAKADPNTLHVSAPHGLACDHPAITGHTVGLSISYTPGGTTGTDAALSIATTDPRTGAVSVGPVVMTYSDCSDCRPETTYGDGIFWIYDNSTAQGGELLEVSDTTGKVITRVEMPKLFRPLLAANDEGLFIANSIEGSPAPAVLYLVTPAARSVQEVVADQSLAACWLVTDPTHVWIGMGSRTGGCTRESVWRLDGTATRPTFRTAPGSYLPPPVGDETSGLWTVRWPTRAGTGLTTVDPQVVRVDPDTGATTLEQTLPPARVNVYLGGLTPGTGVVLDGCLYFLEPPVHDGGGYSALTRVRLSHN